MSSTLTIENIEIQYLDQNSSIEGINQTFMEFSSRTSNGNRKCTSFSKTRNLVFQISYSPPKRISFIEILINFTFFENATINELEVNLSNSPYRNCVFDTHSVYPKNLHSWTFICKFKSWEEAIIPRSIEASFKSRKIFQLAICEIFVLCFHDSCGVPEVPLHASYNRLDDKSVEYFPIPQRNQYRMIGDNVRTCGYEGDWDKELPIFEPIIKCDTNKIDVNSRIYKSIKFENFEYFNKTQTAVIDSKILIQCYNEENSTKILVCNENGLWIGDDLKCKL